MSTSFGVSGFVSLPAFMACAAMLAACATAWSGSTSAGGGTADKVTHVVAEVSKVTPMTPLCKVVGHRVVEVASASRIAAFRPTAGMWEKNEDEAAAAWEAARCPTAALMALLYGASEIAHENQRARTSASAGN